MRRRHLLGAAGTALAGATAGCLRRVLAPTARRRVSLVDVETVGGAHPFELDAALRAWTFGPQSAPALEVTLRSTADEELVVAYAESWPADGLLPERDSDPRGLRLLAAQEATDLTVEYADCPHTSYRPITSPADGRGHVPAGERFAAEYRVVGSDAANQVACPPPGRYRFSSTYAYHPASSGEPGTFPTADAARFNWGFTLELPPEP